MPIPDAGGYLNGVCEATLVSDYPLPIGMLGMTLQLVCVILGILRVRIHHEHQTRQTDIKDIHSSW